MGKIVYNKISDILCRLHRGQVVVKFNVVLNKKDMKGHAVSFHQEYEYSSEKFIECPTMKTIIRDFSYSVQIQFPDKKYVVINPENMLLLRRGLKNAVNWFIDPKYSKLFIIHNKLLVVNKSMNVEPIKVPVAFNKFIEISPAVVNDKDAVTTGIRISSGKTSVSLAVSDLYLLQYHMEELNMHQLASEMINSLKDENTGQIIDKKIESTMVDKPDVEQKSFGVASSRKKKPNDLKDIF